jgi:hypothetical protein
MHRRSHDSSSADPQGLSSCWIPGHDDTTQSMMWQLLKQRTSDDVRQDTEDKESDRDGTFRIRCPLCDWQPSASSRWRCVQQGTPEPPFNACGTVWNTFDTRGKCPGCGHQWTWTTCHQCQVASRHEEWYEED